MPKDIESLLNKGKHYVCQYITSGCYESTNEKSLDESNLIEKHLSQHDHRRLHNVIDYLFDFRNMLSADEFTEWIKYIICGRRLPNNFAKEAKLYDTSFKCNLVWTTNFVAYRCRTCAISLCMSLCVDCFLNGDHEGHDFNMFRSQAGGACDCGDEFVMKTSGFCCHHQKKNASINKVFPPNSLLCIANEVIPRLLYYLVLCLRENNFSTNRKIKALLSDVLIYLNDLGTLMQSIICNALIDTNLYQTSLNTINKEDDLEYQVRLRKLADNYRKAVSEIEISTIFPMLLSKKISDLEITKEIESFQFELKHKSFLDEIIFWTVMAEFPSDLITFLLKMLPNEEYKIHFAECFVKHYFRISMLILHPTENFSKKIMNNIYHNKMANALVHISVQLFSNENLALLLSERSKLLYVIIISLKFSIIGNDDDFNGIITLNFPLTSSKSDSQLFSFSEPLIGPSVVMCNHNVLSFHRYWPIMSDLNNLFTYKSIVLLFLEDDTLMNIWFELMMAFQAMNINVKTAEFDESYQNFQSSYLAELEICASQMWTLIQHLNDDNLSNLTIKCVQHSLKWLEKWIGMVDVNTDLINTQLCSFHLPLHRYYSVFLQHAVNTKNVPLALLLPQDTERLKKVIFHPLQTMIVCNHIMANMWMNLGIQIKTQAFNYIQPHFCNSTIDADLFLIQQAASHINPEEFISMFFNSYGLNGPLNLVPTANNVYDKDKLAIFLENGLTFLATILNIQINSGISKTDVARKEMVSLLSVSGKTYSQLHSMIPLKYGHAPINSFPDILNDIAEFHSPAVEINGNLAQGYFYLKNFVWENEYDPLFVLYRNSQRRDFQSSLERFASFARKTQKYTSSSLPWPPFRILPLKSEKFSDPHVLLNSKILHAYFFSILFKACHDSQWITQHLLSIVTYLIEMSLIEASKHESTHRFEVDHLKTIPSVDQSQLNSWFESNDIIENFFTTIDNMDLVFETESGEVSSLNKMTFFAYLVNSIRSDKKSDDKPVSDCSDSPPNSMENDDSCVDISAASTLLNSEPNNSFDISLDNILINDDDTIDTQHSSTFMIIKNIVISTLNMISMNNLNSASEEFQSFTSLQNEIKVNKLKFILKARPFRVQSEIKESILSLLLKLHSKLSNKRDSFKATVEHLNLYNFDSRIGDGPYFIGCLLKRFIYLCEDRIRSQSSRIDEDNTFVESDFYLNKALNLVDQVRKSIWPEKCAEQTESTQQSTQSDRPMETDVDIDDLQLQEKKRKALERKKQIMSKFSSLQDAFIKSHKVSFDDCNEDISMDSVNLTQDNSDEILSDTFDRVSDNSQSKYRPKMYQCVICGDYGHSTLERSFVQAVLLQSTSILGNTTTHTLFDEFNYDKCTVSHQPSSSRTFVEGACNSSMINSQPVSYRIPTSDEEHSLFTQRITFDDFFEHCIDICSNSFGVESWLGSFNIGWRGGVHAQSCGHLMHMDCYQSYMSTIFKNRDSPELLDYGCPLCRKIVNSVLPIIPNFANLYALVKSRNNDPISVANEVFDLLSNGDNSRLANTTEDESKFLKVLAMSIEDVLKATEPQYRNIRVEPCSQSLFLFLSSISRINLEYIVILWRRNLSMSSNTSCFVPMLHALSLNAKLVLPVQFTRLWSQITGIDSDKNNFNLALYEKQVPLLVKDVSAILLQFIFALPLNIDKAYFISIVQALFNLNFVQTLVLSSFLLTTEQQMEIKAKYQSYKENNERFDNCFDYIGLLLCNFNMNYPMVLSTETRKNFSNQDIIESLTKLCLPFLRISSMIFHLLFNQQGLPSYDTSAPMNVFEEFRTLANYLNLNSSPFSKAIVTGNVDNTFFKFYVNWMNNPCTLITTWYSEFDKFVQANTISAVNLLKYSLTIKHQPGLLELPPIYEQFFMYYLKKTCVMCNTVPKDPSVCLVCGRLVCIRGVCCQNGTVFEGIAHSKKCGAGNAIYLAVNSTSIIVIRGRKACVWGSVYLDEYGEEDRDLKRGKPLFLCKDRYRILEQQWLTHSFFNTHKKWIYHKDSL